MALKLYNSLTGTLEGFHSRREKEILIYTCGPTVHDYAHIGNFRTFIFQDILRRWLEYKGYEIKQVMNLTDVDEKTIERAKRKNMPLEELTGKYIKAFFEDLDALNIERVEHYPRATDHIPQMIELIKSLIEKDYTFEDNSGSIYFDVTKFENYGALSHMDVHETLRAKSKREDYAHSKHFVLWKSWDDMDGDVYWDTDLGKGRPGWHVGCGAMVTSYLGCAIDIHSGGEDLVFPHHENSIAIAESANGCKLVNYWLHTKHLTINGEKMSKSLRNYHTLRDFTDKGYEPMAMRLLLISTHYRKPLDFNNGLLDEAARTLNEIRGTLSALEGVDTPGRNNALVLASESLLSGFEAAVDNDLDIENALAMLIEFTASTNNALKRGEVCKEDAKGCLAAIRKLDTVLGLKL